ncbi:MAG: redoxin domain-containing protein [Desulfopila sp.]
MQSKNWMWLLIIASFFLITACSQNQVTTESPVGTQATAESLVGTQAPAFQLDDTRGGQISLSDYTQQKTPVLLYFHMAVG